MKQKSFIHRREVACTAHAQVGLAEMTVHMNMRK